MNDYLRIEIALAAGIVFALAKASKDSVTFYPTQAWLALRYPKFWGADSWRWKYDKEGKHRFPWWLESIQTPFRDGWHLADSMMTLSALAGGAALEGYGWWAPIAAWVIYYSFFTAIWQRFHPVGRSKS